MEAAENGGVESLGAIKSNVVREQRGSASRFEPAMKLAVNCS
jgi:hypothetical protein